MSLIASRNSFIVTDTKHDNDLLHITSIVVWEPELDIAVTVARMLHNHVDEKAYTDLFRNFFHILEEDRTSVDEYLKKLEGALFDYSTAEANGLRNALQEFLGPEDGERKWLDLLKGCLVHWLRSAERVAKLVCADEAEVNEFRGQCAKMTRELHDEKAARAWFDLMVSLYPGLANWAQWWCNDANGLHLRMLVRGVSTNLSWDDLLNDTNIVESIHNSYRIALHSNLLVELRNFFQLDRNVLDAFNQ